MNIEQKSNMQELSEEDYTKVYAGMMSYELIPKNDKMTIQPFNPSKPKKNTFAQTDLNPTLSTTFSK